MYYIALYGFLGALLALVLSYLDTKLLDNPKERSTYLKNMFMGGLVVVAIVAFIGEDNLGHHKMIGGGRLDKGLNYVSAIGEEIISGPPNF